MVDVIIEWLGDWRMAGLVSDTDGELIGFDTKIKAEKYAKENCQQYKIVDLI